MEDLQSGGNVEYKQGCFVVVNHCGIAIDWQSDKVSEWGCSSLLTWQSNKVAKYQSARVTVWYILTDWQSLSVAADWLCKRMAMWQTSSVAVQQCGRR